jgi:DNA-binding Lrp family transcriptional regulator
MIENEIIDDNELTVYEKMTYIVLCRFARDGECFPSYETIAKRVGCSRQKAINVVKTLCEKGLISKVQRKNDEDEYTSNIYYINGFDNTFEEGNQQELLPNQQEKLPSQWRSPKQDILNNTNLKSQSVSQMDGQTDEAFQQEIDTIINNARVETFEDDDLRETLKEVIRDCYNDTSTRATIRRLRVEHIDIAKAIYIDQQEIQAIKKPLEYFKKCLISAIQESGLKGLF